MNQNPNIPNFPDEQEELHAPDTICLPEELPLVPEAESIQVPVEEIPVESTPAPVAEPAPPAQKEPIPSPRPSLPQFPEPRAVEPPTYNPPTTNRPTPPPTYYNPAVPHGRTPSYTPPGQIPQPEPPRQNDPYAGYRAEAPRGPYGTNGNPQGSTDYPRSGYNDPRNRNGYPQNGNSYTRNGNNYPQNGNGYPQDGYPRNDYPQNGYPQNGYPQGGNNYSYGNSGFGNVPPSPYGMPGAPYPNKDPKKKRSNGWLLALLITGCVLIGTVCGVVIAGLGNNSGSSAEVPTASQPLSPTEDKKPASTESATHPTRETQPLATVSGEKMDLENIYDTNVPAIVGISKISVMSSGYGQTSSVTGTGSGFIISSEGEILTNYHVIQGADQIAVTLHDGSEYPASLIGFEAESDVALIKIEATNLPVCAIGNSDQIRVGEQIAAIGNPMGELSYTLTVGYVSAVDRFVTTDGVPISMIQVDAAINPGNSGGPIFNLYGEVIGIATAKYSGTLSNGATLEGLGFAIPINDVVEILNDLRVNGKVPDRAYMGVIVSMLAPDKATYGIDHGVYVQSVDEGGSAYKAGVRANDIILKIGDVETNAYENLQQALRKYRAGDSSTITVYRNGETITLSIVFDAKPESTEIPTESQYVEPTEPESTESPWETFPWGDFPWG